MVKLIIIVALSVLVLVLFTNYFTDFLAIFNSSLATITDYCSDFFSVLAGWVSTIFNNYYLTLIITLFVGLWLVLFIFRFLGGGR